MNIHINKSFLMLVVFGLTACGGGSSSSGGGDTPPPPAVMNSCLILQNVNVTTTSIQNICTFAVNVRVFRVRGTTGFVLAPAETKLDDIIEPGTIHACEVPFIPVSGANGVFCST